MQADTKTSGKSDDRLKVELTYLPVVGFNIDNGTMKSEVRMMFFSQSMVRPCGENCSPRILSVPLTSSGCSWMMLRSLSVSINRPLSNKLASITGEAHAEHEIN